MSKQISYTVAQIALNIPLNRLFDYQLIKPVMADQALLGRRVLVPFRKQAKIGIIISLSQHSIHACQLKTIMQYLDTESILDKASLELCQWLSQYYHQPLGQVIFTALPNAFKKPNLPKPQQTNYWRITSLGQTISSTELKRAPKQARCLALFQQHPLCSRSDLTAHHIPFSVLNKLLEKDWITACDVPAPLFSPPAPVQLNEEQRQACQHMQQRLNQFHCTLLYGITGSGKTEVYIQMIDLILQQDKQALFLIPEIGLTNQTLQRLQARFQVPLVILHSNLTERERYLAWQQAKQNSAKLIVGTRSAIFTPLPNLGLIIIDEEHDSSFKQSEQTCYSARDLAIIRAQKAQIPIILGSATPSLESLYNVKQKRYDWLTLPKRAGYALTPTIGIINLRQQALLHGLSLPLREAMAEHLEAGNQVLLFVNRRGFAPVLICKQCGIGVSCSRCSAYLIQHHQPSHLLCHHCGQSAPIPTACPTCQMPTLQPLGYGTERIEQGLKQLFQVPIIRVDRDTIKHKHSFSDILERIQNNGRQILVGTQMLAKGHHFPNITLVGILNADNGLYSHDFRACEKIGQLIVQVAGRAGRATKPGTVLIQTYQPNHPKLSLLLHQNYLAFAEQLLKERTEAELPPYAHQVLFRSEANCAQHARTTLETIKQILNHKAPKQLDIFGPIAAPLEKKSGKYRMQLLLQSKYRSILQTVLTNQAKALEQVKQNARSRWSIDVDPYDLNI